MKTYDEVAKVTYEGPDSREPFAFKYYNPDEMLVGKPMREHLRFALSWWTRPSVRPIPWKSSRPRRTLALS